MIEVKAIEQLRPVHDAQLLTYLRLSGLRLGLILNFGSVLLKEGIRHLVLQSQSRGKAFFLFASLKDPDLVVETLDKTE